MAPRMTANKAWDAVKMFRSRLDEYERLAQMISGNPNLRVIPTAEGSRTDGTNLWLKVPASFADKVSHVRRSCRVRDEKTNAQTCPGCFRADDVQGALYHELGHCSFGSFEDISYAQAAQLVKTGENAIGRYLTKGRREQVDKLLYYSSTVQPWELACAISPHLRNIANGIEDARVNRAMFTARSGMKIMFQERTERFVRDGVPQPDGTIMLWKEQHVDAQVTIGFLLAASEYKIKRGWLDKGVRAFVASPPVHALLEKVITATSVYQIFELSCRLYMLGKEAGYFVEDEDPPEQEQGEGQDEGEQGDDDGEAGGGDGKSAEDESEEHGQGEGNESPDEKSDSDEGEGDADGEEGDAEGEPGPGQGTPSDGDLIKALLALIGGHADDDTPVPDKTIELIKQAIIQQQFFDESSVLTGVRVQTATEGYDLPPKPPEAVMAPALLAIRSAFQENAKDNRQHGQRSGRVNPAALARVATGEVKVFSRRTLPGRRDWFVVLGLDISGSTGWADAHGVVKLEPMKAAISAQVELLNRIGIKSAVYAHSSDNQNVRIFVVQEPGQPWTDVERRRLEHLRSISGNLDGHTLEFYRKVAEQSRATDKLILYYTDGAMPAQNRAEELRVLQREIKHCQSHGIHIVGVGYQNDDPKAHGLDTIRFDSIRDVPKIVDGLKARLLV